MLVVRIPSYVKIVQLLSFCRSCRKAIYRMDPQASVSNIGRRMFFLLVFSRVFLKAGEWRPICIEGMQEQDPTSV